MVNLSQGVNTFLAYKCCSNISNGIIKDVKDDPRNKWEKAVSSSLDTNSIDAAIND